MSSFRLLCISINNVFSLNLILLPTLIWKGEEDEKLVKVANVRKDNYNINIMENFPMDIEIGPKVRINLLG